MTRQEHLQFCKVCEHKKFDPDQGIICSLTEKLADFDPSCENFVQSEVQKQKQAAKQYLNTLLNLASQGDRFANYLIDRVLMLIFIFGIVVVIGILIGLFYPEMVDSITAENTARDYLVSFILGLFYYSFFEGLTGKSPAKFITGTRVVDEKGNKASFSAILTRSLCRFIPFNAFSFLGGDGVGWHDTLSKTRVVKNSKRS